MTAWTDSVYHQLVAGPQDTSALENSTTKSFSTNRSLAPATNASTLIQAHLRASAPLPTQDLRAPRSQLVECPDLQDENLVVLTSKIARWLWDFCVFGCALLCSVVPNATGATRILLIKSKLNFQSLRYEPGGREFESVRARQ